ncbi:MAG: universal stress protein [Luteolibacter sp.]
MSSDDQLTDSPDSPVKKILVPIDFSPPSQRALLHALHAAHRAKKHLCIIHVSKPIPCPPRCTAREYIADQELHRQRVKNEITDLVAKLWTGPFAGTLEPLATEGVPSHEIIHAAQRHDIDVIVISTYGRAGIKRFFLGSTTDHVVRFAPCSVLVVKKKFKGEMPSLES